MRSSHNYSNTAVPWTACICMLYSNSLIAVETSRLNYCKEGQISLEADSVLYVFAKPVLGKKTYWNS